MRVRLGLILGFFLCSVLTQAWSSNSEATGWFTKADNNQYKLRVDLFLSSICPHCHKADAFFRELESQDPSAYEIHRYIINTDKAALETFNKALQAENSDSFSVPAIFFCNSHWVGFDQAETTGKKLLLALNYCREQLTQSGALNEKSVAFLRQWANADLYSTTIMGAPSAGTFVPLMAITDGLNPCSFFAMLSLISFLLISKNRRIQLGLTILFLIISGGIHYLQQRYNIAFHQALEYLRLPAVLIGCGLIAYLYMIYNKGLSAYQGLITALVVGSSALVIHAYQQTCTPNYALVAQQWLSTQQLSALSLTMYFIFYQFVYLLSMVFVVVLFMFFYYYKLNKYQQILNYMAACFLLVVAGFSIVYPQGLSNIIFSLFALFFAWFVAFVIRRYQLTTMLN